MNLSIPDNNASGASSTIAISGTAIQIEHVEVTVELTHERAGDLIIKLVSPTGTESVLMDRPGKVPGSGSEDRGDILFNDSSTLNFTFTTTHDWGESPNGTWTLTVIDAAGDDTGTLTNWSIDVFGKGDTGNDIYYYTDEYAALASSGGRDTLSDADGGEDTINLAAVSGNSLVNLTTGSATIAGTELTIANPANFENAIGGDGNDTLVGNGAGNSLFGGRGGDLISGGDGDDLLRGFRDSDTLTGGNGFDTFIIERQAGESDVVSDFIPFDEAIFVDQDTFLLVGFGDDFEFSDLQFGQQGADAVMTLPDGQTVVLKNVDESSLGSVDFAFAPRLGLPDFLVRSDGATQVAGTVLADSITGTSSADLVFGLEGDDDIETGGGDDVILPGSGADAVRAGEGSDIIFIGDRGGHNLAGTGDNVFGGEGSDTFALAPDPVSDISRTFVRDFALSEGETIDFSRIAGVTSLADLSLSTVTVGGLTSTLVSPWQDQSLLIYLVGIDPSSITSAQFRFYDGNPEPLPEIEAEASETPGQVLGTLGGDLLEGDAGGNTLDGGAGADSMSGRTGDDTYLVDDANDEVIELPDGGFDHIRSSVSYVLPEHVESLKLTGSAAIDGTGNAASNRVTGNAGNNTLDGGLGADVLKGRPGDDNYIVDHGSDEVVEVENEGTDLVLSSVSFTLAPNVENLTLTGAAPINATGNALNNILIGNANDNRLDGAQGADTMRGGNGDDAYFVDNASDVVSEDADGGIDLVFSGIDYELPLNFENLTATGNAARTLTGNALDNVIVGIGAGDTMSGGDGDDLLDGRGGADSLIGGAGNDIYIVDNDGDVLVEAAASGTDLVQASISYTLGSNFENLGLLAGGLTGTGNSLANVLTGSGGADTLVGADGSDLMLGSDGNDSVLGDAGNDTLFGGVGNDTVFGGTDDDSVTGGDGDDSLRGSMGNDTVTDLGYLGDDTLEGSDGNDLLLAGDGNDSLSGGNGVDFLDGGEGDDSVMGDAGNDTVYGGVGHDSVFGGPDNDSVTGGDGNDSMRGSTGDDTVSDVGYLGDDTLEGSDGNDLLLAGDGNDSLSGGNGVDFLDGGEGDDSVMGDAGNDTVYGGVGHDSVFGGPDNDSVTGGDGNDSMRGSTGDDTVSDVGYLGDDTLEGSDGNDLLLAGDGNDSLSGSDGVDSLNGGAGADTMTGGAGMDRFVYGNVSEAADAISDFVAGSGGDLIDLEAVYAYLGYTGLDPIADGHLKLTQSGLDTLVKIDADGFGGSAATLLVTLTGVTATTLTLSDNFQI